VVGIVEWRDGTVVDVIRQVLYKKSKYEAVKSDISFLKNSEFEEGKEN